MVVDKRVVKPQINKLIRLLCSNYITRVNVWVYAKDTRAHMCLSICLCAFWAAARDMFGVNYVSFFFPRQAALDLIRFQYTDYPERWFHTFDTFIRLDIGIYTM
jgi:hypothetical protein